MITFGCVVNEVGALVTLVQRETTLGRGNMSLHVFLAVPHDEDLERRLQTRTMHDRDDKHVVTKKSEAFMQMSNQFSPEVNGNCLLASLVIDGLKIERLQVTKSRRDFYAKIKSRHLTK